MNSKELFKVLHSQEMTIDTGFWYRIVIEMSRYKIKQWVLNESAVDYEVVTDGMSDANRKLELQKPSGTLINDPSLKDGKVGVFAKNASGLMFSNIII